MRGGRTLVPTLAVLLTLSACYQRTERLPAVDQEARRLAAERPTLTLCVVPVRSPREAMIRHGPLAARLSEVLGGRVELRAARDWSTAVDRLERGETDLALLGAVAFERARRRFGVIGLARQQTDDGAAHRGTVAVRRDDPARQLVDLRGRRLGLVCPESSAGQLLVLGALRDAGLAPGDLGGVTYEGRHDLVARSIRLERVDAGAMRDETFRRHEQDLRAIWRSEPVPGPVLAARPGLPEETVQAVRDVLLGPPGAGVDGNEDPPRFRALRAEDGRAIDALLIAVYGEGAHSRDLRVETR